MSETAEKPRPERHGIVWLEAEEREIYDAYLAGEKMSAIAAKQGRSRGGVASHLRELGVLDELGAPVQPPPDFAPTPAAQKRAAKGMTVAPPRVARVAKKFDDAAVKTEINPRFAEAIDVLKNSNQSLFITGRAGTGKSTLLKYFRRETKKNMVVLAPTGIAALNVGGQTIHNFFRFPIDITPQKVRDRSKPRNAKLYKKLEMIVIDEISMVRADIMDCIDTYLRHFGPQVGEPFGGVQMIFIGDLYQLPPVVGDREREIFADFYETPYFFSAQVMRDFDFRVIELEKVYRQKDGDFIALLNRVRDNRVTDRDLAVLNARLNAANGHSGDGISISLTTTNRRADEINDGHLSALTSRKFNYTAVVQGDFGREYFPAATDLSFKIGAQIMMLNNDKEGRWVNGSIGVIEDVTVYNDQGDDSIAVRLQGSTEVIDVSRHTWDVYAFALAGEEIQSQSVGSFTQYPFRLAWAVTIHKSQGKTFDRVAIDLGQGAFASGQVYVALSRCRTLEGITLQTPIQRRHIKSDARIHGFMERYAPVLLDEPVDNFMGDKSRAGGYDAKITMIEAAIRGKTALSLHYRKADGTEIRLVVYPHNLRDHTYQGNIFTGMTAFSPDTGKDLLFDVGNILDMAVA